MFHMEEMVSIHVSTADNLACIYSSYTIYFKQALEIYLILFLQY